jgi:hypothetical protein
MSVSHRKVGPSVNHLPSVFDLEKAVDGGVVTHCSIAAPCEPVIEQPVIESTLGLGYQLNQGHGSGPPEFVEDVSKLSVLGRAVGVDNSPEGRRFLRRRLRVEA